MNQYSLWRYILLALIILISVIYAIPNFYGEDYAVQITSKNATALNQDLLSKINEALKKDNIVVISEESESSNILIRLQNNEAQIKSQSIIQAVLGDEYSVALNLAAKTPNWLRALGAKPMKLGLDLRGGIHFLLKVDVDAMIKEREKSDIQNIITQLREARIRYLDISPHDHEIVIRFRDQETQNQAESLLRKEFGDYLLQKPGPGFVLTATLTQETINKLQEYAVAQNMGILRNRVDELGVAEPVIMQQGRDHISVDLPGIQDTARAKDLIGKVATVRFQFVDSEHDAQASASSGIIPFGSSLYNFEDHPVLLKNKVVLSGESITHASTTSDEYAKPAVQIRTGGGEVSQFNKITGENVGQSMATVYAETIPIKQLVDGKVVTHYRQVAKIINIATVRSALGNSFQITGLDSPLYAQDLALQLRSGAYSAPIMFVQEQVVGPSLGQQNIDRGVLSCVIGSLIVILFMAFYYRLFGVVADLALILNVVLLVAVMSILEFTLTLPGIAAIVLTVGMAVDANVLINERIREELRLGRSPQAAIYSGYGRAFTTIVDANVTTLIVALVLFALGTSSVQGFAVTLMIGLSASMLTSIFFTRALINLIYGKRAVKQLSIGIRVNAAAISQSPNNPFNEKR